MFLTLMCIFIALHISWNANTTCFDVFDRLDNKIQQLDSKWLIRLTTSRWCFSGTYKINLCNAEHHRTTHKKGVVWVACSEIFLPFFTSSSLKVLIGLFKLCIIGKYEVIATGQKLWRIAVSMPLAGFSRMWVQDGVVLASCFLSLGSDFSLFISYVSVDLSCILIICERQLLDSLAFTHTLLFMPLFLVSAYIGQINLSNPTIYMVHTYNTYAICLQFT